MEPEVSLMIYESFGTVWLENIQTGETKPMRCLVLYAVTPGEPSEEVYSVAECPDI